LRLGTRGNPQSSLITIFADAGTSGSAEFVANSAASAAVNFLKEDLDSGAVARFPLDHSAEGWDTGAGIYVLPPGVTKPGVNPAHAGEGSLEATCKVLVVGGCGPYSRLERPAFKGRVYEASGWVQALHPVSLRLVMGSSPTDVAVAETVRVGTVWRHITVQWIPHAGTSAFVAAVQIMSVGEATLRVDDFEIGPRAGLRGASGTPATPPPAKYETVVPATSAVADGGVDTGTWAAGGAAAGLLVAAAALAAARAAKRRKVMSGPGRA
jgi:hypothetical protein